MSIGFLALLDDIAGLAKVAAASIDDVAGQAAKAGAKAAGVVIDDAAVTPRYVVGFAADRELPIVGAIAAGSLRNKLLILLPVALALGALAPWAIMPLLMIGGGYLAYEGTEKAYEALFPNAAHEHEAHIRPVAATPQAREAEKVASAIKTDFILSAEIMAITLAAVPAGGFWSRAVIMALVGVGITVLVYAGVALIVKADDVGLALARSGSKTTFGTVSRVLGRGLVIGMPVFLKILAVVGTAAMIWVGGGIIVHGLEEYGLSAVARVIHDAAEAAAHALPWSAAVTGWLVTAAGAAVVGLATGAALIPIVGRVFAPIWRRLRGSHAAPAANLNPRSRD
jgi:predicted DNA repair protein MutK